MSATPPPTQRKAGSVLFGVLAMMIFVLPMLLMFVRFGNIQNRQTLRYRNIKTAREMAEAVQADYMNTFSTDWHKDGFDALYTLHEWVGFPGLGGVGNSLDPRRNIATFFVTSTSRYDKDLKMNQIEIERKSINAAYYFSSDELKFDYVFPGDVTLGANVSGGFAGITQGTNTFFVGGNLSALVGTGAVLRGQWIATGTFTSSADLQFNNAAAPPGGRPGRVHCSTHIDNGGIKPTFIRQFGSPNDFVPKIEIVTPSATDPLKDLSYYRMHSSTELVVANGTSLELIFGFNGLPRLFYQSLDPTLTPIPGTQNNWTYTVSASTDLVLVTVDARLGDVYFLNTSTIDFRTTLSVWGGGDSHVRGNILYTAGALTASNQRGFALLSEGDVDFDGNVNQNLVGLYATTSGNLVFDSAVIRTIGIRGTLYGFIQIPPLAITPTLFVTADPNLAQYPPPLYPRRPKLIGWRYKA